MSNGNKILQFPRAQLRQQKLEFRPLLADEVPNSQDLGVASDILLYCQVEKMELLNHSSLPAVSLQMLAEYTAARLKWIDLGIVQDHDVYFIQLGQRANIYDPATQEPEEALAETLQRFLDAAALKGMVGKLQVSGIDLGDVTEMSSTYYHLIHRGQSY